MIDSWLTPEGKIIEVGQYGHNEYALKLLDQEIKNEGLFNYLCRNDVQYPYEILHKRGWIRIKYHSAYLPKIQILGGCIDLTKPMRNTIDPAMNERQFLVAKELCDQCDTPIYEAINDKRFW